MTILSPPRLRDIAIDADSFWGRRRAVNRAVTIPSQARLLRETGRLAALDPLSTAPRHRFWDSDVAKWLEAAWSELDGGADDPALRAEAEAARRAFAGALQADGYLHSYTSFAAPSERYRNLRDGHELYSMGHVLESCGAEVESGRDGGSRAIAARILDHLWRQFGPGGVPGYCGHPEVELALLRLWRAGGDARARQLAQLMVDRRGTAPHWFDAEAAARGEDPRQHWSWKFTGDWRYFQAHRPVREQIDAEGHAVRAMYLFCAMADLCAAGDETLEAPLDRLWESVVHRRMYVTGGIGSAREGERFTQDYDLPDNGAYCETCAAIGLARWAQRMLGRRLRGEYGDVLELALHNAMLAGVSRDGERYFYGNPLAVHPHDRRGHEEVSAHRRPWFGCACCPPNVARTLAQLGAFAYAGGDGLAAIHLYVPGAAQVAGLSLRVTTDVPWDGHVRIEMMNEATATLALRLPGWCPAPRVTGDPDARDGYAYVSRTWHRGDVIELDLPMPAQRLYAHPAVRACAGKVALRRGPLVYGVEEADCGRDLDDVALPDTAAITVEGETLRATGTRSAPGGGLYRVTAPARVPAPLTWVPYAHWGHRGGAEMRVWLRRAERPA